MITPKYPLQKKRVVLIWSLQISKDPVEHISLRKEFYAFHATAEKVLLPLSGSQLPYISQLGNRARPPREI